jgi:hypothetical protein
LNDGRAGDTVFSVARILGVDSKADPARDLKSGGDSPLLSLPFDHYQRYALTQKLVRQLSPDVPSHQPLLVLDVGGSSSSLKHFLPDDHVVLADVQGPPEFTHRKAVPFRYDEYVFGAGQQLPFRDGSFDLVTAHDTLEHVPTQFREAFLQDVLRVSRRYVILSGPTFDEEVAASERRLAEYMQRGLGGVNASLREHIDLGLPDEEFIHAVLTADGASTVVLSSGNLLSWLTMMALKHYVIAFPDSDWLHEVLDRTYNILLSPRDMGGRCYRKTFVLAKDPADASKLRNIAEGFDSITEPAHDAPLPGVMDTLLSALEEHAGSVGKNVVSLRDSVERLRSENLEHEKTIADRDATIARTEAEVIHLHQVLDERTEQVRERDRKLQETGLELQAIRDSTGYRLIKLYRGGTRRLLPPGSPLGSVHRALLWPVRRVLDAGAGVKRKGKRNR